MAIIIAVILLIFGGLLLWKGANWLVDGASDIASFFKVPPIYIGLTIVAFGTSLPELVVSLYAILTDKAGISIGNIIGSNIANIGLIVGLAAMVYPLAVKKKTLTYELPIMIILTFLFPILSNKNYIFRENKFYIGWFGAGIFLLCFAVFLYYVFKSAGIKNKPAKPKNKNPMWKNITIVLLGSIMLYFGGNFFVDSSSSIARFFGISELLIGLTIVSIGTSMPELFTSVVAAFRHKAQIAVGNIVGSNIFNIGWVLGIVGLIRRIDFDAKLVYMDAMVMIGFALLFTLFAAKSKKIKRGYGAVLFLGYVSYIAYLILANI
ncbi:calcium/sodium antiporter [Candidatus Woesearchaeota archaeon]|nr:calcium/sodium antiporter [Candidatus Woesearchaeota archaeon]